MEGFKRRSSEKDRLKLDLERYNRDILNKINTLLITTDKSNIDSGSIGNSISFYNNTLNNMKNSINRINSDHLNGYYAMTYKNFTVLYKLFYNLQNNIYPITSNLDNASLTMFASTPTPTPTSAITTTISINTPTNIPNSLPSNKISNKKRDTINASDISKLYNTVEGLTNNEEYFTDYISAYNINMPIIEGLTDADNNNIQILMSKERELLDQLADFNTKYERYIHCNDVKTNSDCGANEPTSAQLIAKIDTINGIINTMNGKQLTSTPEYQTNHSNIVTNYDNVVNLRNDLDIKLKQLYDPENSKIVDFKYSYDSTIYSGILISALATSLLYYIFTEL